MFGQNKIICIAGKNQCSIDFVKFINNKIPKKNILIIPNKNDDGLDNWQPSLKKFAKLNNLKVLEKKFSKEDMFKAKEVFLTSASSFVTPINEIDEVKVNNGNIGQLSVQLKKLYFKNFESS